MFEDIEVERMFDNQVHERHKFKVSIQGEEYQGILHKGEVDWFHPQPSNKLEDEHIDQVESSIQDHIMNTLEG